MFSPTSIADFIACKHLAALNRAATADEIERPYFSDPGLELLKRLGQAHEENYLGQFTENPALVIAQISPEISWTEAAAQTITAIHSGADVIYQATFIADQWQGRADFLRRVEKPSSLGPWSYEVVETKLARSTKARAIIQLCFYSELLSVIQGAMPDYMHVVLGRATQPESFFVHRYMAYFRRIRREFEAAQQVAADTYPEPVEHCRACIWSSVCDKRWHDDDHLSLVAGISTNQRRALVECDVSTVIELARSELTRVDGIGTPALASIREQARLQVQGRELGHHIYELLEPAAEAGLCSLPPPSPGDMFLDFEGDPFASEHGLEYLFGIATPADIPGGTPGYQSLWALNPAEEKRAFETFISSVKRQREQYPNMHIYHYAAYEETAIKRMAGLHGTCVDDVDELLRAGVLVDLYRVVRQSLRASVESYSIKKLEPLYGFDRDVRLIDATIAMSTFQTVLAFGPGAADIAEIRDAIEGYNRDDCISTLRLRDWLEDRRIELEARDGAALPRPAAGVGEVTDNLTAYLDQVRAVETRLVAGIPTDESERTDEQQAQWLLAQLLEWHRREDKSAWWEYFRLCDLTDQELQEDATALAGLVYAGVVGTDKKSLIHRYRFPAQDHAIDRARTIVDPRTKAGAGTKVAIDTIALTIDIKRAATSLVPHPVALIPKDIIGSEDQRNNILKIGSWVADNGIAGPGEFSAARDLLLRRPPRLRTTTLAALAAANPNSTELARSVGVALDHTVLALQGPPGSGKTHIGARMIVELLKKGKKVGVMAGSHKVISKLLEKTCEAAREAGVNLKAVQKADGGDCCADDFVTRVDKNEAVLNALESSAASLAAGTVWLWSRSEMAASVDVLFVDEAGQMSLANVLAASPAAQSVVLLGDPQQLDQPQRGVHPPGADASALSHLLNGQATIHEDQGLFLAESWRLHPDICAFTSELFYDNRLTARTENAAQRLNVDGPLDGTGLRFIPVAHSGNQNESYEEVEIIATLVNQLLRTGATWTNKHGVDSDLLLNHILIVAPYNAQVAVLSRLLPDGAKIGTVDKFQGQEAPVVIYSMTTSTPADAPRGMEFLYSANRLNVATSRAQCVTVLVANPALFDVQCRTPRQIELANAFCRYIELAQEV